VCGFQISVPPPAWRAASLIEKETLLFLIVGAVFNRDCPGKSRLEAAPTSH